MSQISFISFSVFTFLAIGLLTVLGNWQIDRGAEKRALVAMAEARVLAPPMSIGDVEKRWRDNNDIEYLRVEMTGRFDHLKERYLFATFKGMKGWHVYTPFLLKSGRVVFVNRGFVSDAVTSRGARKSGLIEGETALIGLVRRAGEKGAFDPTNDLEGNVWYWRDLSNMVASVYDKTKVSAYPFFVEVEAEVGSANGHGQREASQTRTWPRSGVTRLRFRDNHMQYAMTWYGLAITVVAVYGFFLRNWLRQRGAS